MGKVSVQLGKTYRDSITGFEGVATSKTEYLHGCKRIGLQSKDLKDGKPVDPQPFDEHQLIPVESAEEYKPKFADTDPGGPGYLPPSRRICPRA